MTIADNITRSKSRPSLPILEAGDRLDQPTFHARYKAMPSKTRAELIEGVVHVPSPVSARHGKPHAALVGWLIQYAAATPGVEVYDNTTAILGEDSEPQPDAALLTIGGQTTQTADGYLAGSPELVCEIASSTESIDLHAKKRDYEKYGAREYLVVAVRTAAVFWFTRAADGRFSEILPGPDGLFRSILYPGLWLQPSALLDGNLKTLLETLAGGLQSPEHSAFVSRVL